MNREEIIRMAQEADGHHDALERFAALVAAAKEAELMDSMTIAYMDGYEKGKDAGAAAEREVCAKVAKDFGPSRPMVEARPSERVIGRWEGEQAASGSIAAAIRARGQA